MNWKGKGVLITGGAGFIGSHLAEKLLEYNASVTIYDNFNEYYRGKESNIEQIKKDENLLLEIGDILDYRNLCRICKKADVVFHLAAQPGIRYSVIHPFNTNKINVEGTLNVLEALKKSKVKLVFTSSSSVYGNINQLPVKETADTHPISVYGDSKLAAEKYCKVYNKIYDLNVVTLRYFTVYGPRQRPDMAIHKFVEQISNQQPLTVYGDGSQTRDFTYIDDVIQGTLKAAEAEGMGGEVFNLGSGSRISIINLLEMLKEQLGKFDITYQKEKKGEVKHTLADISKAEKLLGHRPQFNLKQGLSQFISWYKK